MLCGHSWRGGGRETGGERETERERETGERERERERERDFDPDNQNMKTLLKSLPVFVTAV